jgi:hypothetical protein
LKLNESTAGLNSVIFTVLLAAIASAKITDPVSRIESEYVPGYVESKISV